MNNVDTGHFHTDCWRILALGLCLAATPIGAGAFAEEKLNPYKGVSTHYKAIDTIKPITLRWGDYYARTSSASLGSRAFMDYVVAATEGKVKFEPYWSGALFSEPEGPASIAAGIADIGPILPIYKPAEFPINNWLGGFATQAKGGAPYGSLLITGAGSEFFASNENIKAEFENAGLHILAVQGLNSYDMLCTSPIKSLADAKGKNVRTGPQVHSQQVAALGMVPVAVSFTETYEAFSRGLIDCTVQKPDQYLTTGLTGIQRDLYWIDVNLSGYLSAALAINADVWAKMPPVLRQIMTDASIEFMARKTAGVQIGTVEFGKLLKAGKINYIKPDAEILNILAQSNQGLSGMINTAPASVTDPAGAVVQFELLLKKWTDILSNELKFSPIPSDVSAIPAYWAQDFDYGPYATRLSKELDVGAAK